MSQEPSTYESHYKTIPAGTDKINPAGVANLFNITGRHLLPALETLLTSNRADLSEKDRTNALFNVVRLIRCVTDLNFREVREKTPQGVVSIIRCRLGTGAYHKHQTLDVYFAPDGTKELLHDYELAVIRFSDGNRL